MMVKRQHARRGAAATSPSRPTVPFYERIAPSKFKGSPPVPVVVAVVDVSGASAQVVCGFESKSTAYRITGVRVQNIMGTIDGIQLVSGTTADGSGLATERSN